MTDTTATIDEDGRVDGDPLADVKRKLKRQRAFWERWARKAIKPEAFAKPDVIRGGGRHGVIQRDPGYLRHLSYDIHADGSGYTLISTRPYLPEQDELFLRQQDEAYAEFLTSEAD